VILGSGIIGRMVQYSRELSGYLHAVGGGRALHVSVLEESEERSSTAAMVLTAANTL